jgi:5'-nucleotidase
MDDTIADFSGSPLLPSGYPFDVHAMYEPGFFIGLKVIPGALSAVREIIRMGYEVQILSQPVDVSSHSYSEKVQWIGLHFPDLISKINFTQDKGNFVGDYLIDDNEEKWKDKFEANGGKFIVFPYTRKNPVTLNTTEINWRRVVDFLKQEKENGSKTS